MFEHQSTCRSLPQRSALFLVTGTVSSPRVLLFCFIADVELHCKRRGAPVDVHWRPLCLAFVEPNETILRQSQARSYHFISSSPIQVNFRGANFLESTMYEVNGRWGAMFVTDVFVNTQPPHLGTTDLSLSYNCQKLNPSIKISIIQGGRERGKIVATLTNIPWLTFLFYFSGDFLKKVIKLLLHVFDIKIRFVENVYPWMIQESRGDELFAINSRINSLLLRMLMFVQECISECPSGRSISSSHRTGG